MESQEEQVLTFAHVCKDNIALEVHVKVKTNSIQRGQFRTKKTGFEVTVSELIFLGQNMLVRPHEVD